MLMSQQIVCQYPSTKMNEGISDSTASMACAARLVSVVCVTIAPANKKDGLTFGKLPQMFEGCMFQLFPDVGNT